VSSAETGAGVESTTGSITLATQADTGSGADDQTLGALFTSSDSGSATEGTAAILLLSDDTGFVMDAYTDRTFGDTEEMLVSIGLLGPYGRDDSPLSHKMRTKYRTGLKRGLR
jgi:hypothetical protein